MAINEKGVKYDSGKPDYSLVPPLAQDEFVRVLTFGADKYGRDNWRKLEDLRNRYIAAAGRHLNAIMRGELRDPESGLLHSAHLQSCAAFLSEYEFTNVKRTEVSPGQGPKVTI